MPDGTLVFGNIMTDNIVDTFIQEDVNRTDPYMIVSNVILWHDCTATQQHMLQHNEYEFYTSLFHIWSHAILMSESSSSGIL